ncbi:MAG: hypothetical protein LBJ87_15810 [bacterium]|nr:hypothetical protein [bacterium]
MARLRGAQRSAQAQAEVERCAEELTLFAHEIHERQEPPEEEPLAGPPERLSTLAPRHTWVRVGAQTTMGIQSHA